MRRLFSACVWQIIRQRNYVCAISLLCKESIGPFIRQEQKRDSLGHGHYKLGHCLRKMAGIWSVLEYFKFPACPGEYQHKKCPNLYRIFMSLFEPNWQLLGIEKMLQRMAVLQLILYISINGGDVRRVTWNSLVVVRGWEKAKWENLWDCIKNKTKRHILLLRWCVQDS